MYGNSNVATFPLAVLKPIREPRYYTLSEYLQREERATERHEYYNGIITKLPMSKVPHNIIVANMTAELIFAFRTNNKDFTVMGSQQLVYLPELNFSLYPDVLTVAETPQCWDKNEVLLINPLLIVEVLSRSTRKYDRTDKFDEYKTLPSFREYILIDPNKCWVETRFREAPNLWRDKVYTDMSDIIALKSVGCTLDMALIYKKIVFKK
jgi:Uma2 family endonuclease